MLTIHICIIRQVKGCCATVMWHFVYYYCKTVVSILSVIC